MFSFQEWLLPSPNEEASLKEIEKCFDAKGVVTKITDLINILNSQNISSFIKLTELNPHLHKFCLQHTPDIESICLKHLTRFNINKSNFFITTDNLYGDFTAYKLLKGWYFFSWIKIIRNDLKKLLTENPSQETQIATKKLFKQKELSFLEKSVSYNFYNALRLQLIYKKRILFSTPNPSQEALTDFLRPASLAVKHHSTLGYLLSCYANEILYHLTDRKNDKYAMDGLTALLAARELFENSDSQKAIYIAYSGQGLGAEEIFNFSSWEKAIDNYVSNNNLQGRNLEICYEEKTKIINNLCFSSPGVGSPRP